MTRYVLCGGILTWESLEACQVEGDAKVLICPWAQWGLDAQVQAFNSMRETLWWSVPDDITFFMARPKDFTIQLGIADVLIFPGGDSPLLINRLQPFKDLLKPLLNSKTVLAISAGVSALTAASFNSDHQRVIRGLGLIPRASMVHYQPNRMSLDSAVLGTKAAEKLLRQAAPEYDTLFLRDDEHAVIEA